jgi:hypothetical protein
MVQVPYKLLRQQVLSCFLSPSPPTHSNWKDILQYLSPAIVQDHIHYKLLHNS